MDFVMLIGLFVLLSCGVLPLGFAILLFVAERRGQPDPGPDAEADRRPSQAWGRARGWR